MPASRAIASAVASAKPLRAKTAEAAANSRARWRSCRTSSGGAWRPRGAVSCSPMVLDGSWRGYPLAPHAPPPPLAPAPARRRARRLRAAGRPPRAISRAPRRTSPTRSSSSRPRPQSRKPEDICSDVLARSLVDKLKTSGNDCVDEMEKVTGDADDFELDVTAVTITGDTATARDRGAQGRQGRRHHDLRARARGREVAADEPRHRLGGRRPGRRNSASATRWRCSSGRSTSGSPRRAATARRCWCRSRSCGTARG